MATVIAHSLFSVEELAAPYANPTAPKTTGYDIPQIKLSYVRERRMTYAYSVTGSDTFASIFRPFYDTGEMDFHEVIFVAYVNRANKVIGVQRIGTGTESASVCDVKALFAGAILCRASGFALCHNHPSGGLRPSEADIKLTREIKQIATFHNLRFLDHLILTAEKHYSFHDNGMMPNK